jgi:hypothetical protein
MRHDEYHIHSKQTIRLIKWALHADGKREITDIMEFGRIAGARRRWKRVMRRNDKYDAKTFPECAFVITEERAARPRVKDNERFPLLQFTPWGRVITVNV